MPDDLHRQLLQEYINVVLYRDIVDRYDIKNHHIVKLFLFHCLQNLAAPLSVARAFHILKSLGEKLGKNSLYENLTYFEDAYAIFTVPIFNYSSTKRQVNPKKIYACDPGLIAAYSIKPEFDKTTALENAVFSHLRRKYRDIFYYKTKSDKEIDFVVLTAKGERELYQVCLDIKACSTLTREISAFVEAAKELQSDKLTLITEHEEKTITQEGLCIECVPFWKWAGLLTSQQWKFVEGFNNSGHIFQPGKMRTACYFFDEHRVFIKSPVLSKQGQRGGIVFFTPKDHCRHCWDPAGLIVVKKLDLSPVVGLMSERGAVK